MPSCLLGFDSVNRELKGRTTQTDGAAGGWTPFWLSLACAALGSPDTQLPSFPLRSPHPLACQSLQSPGPWEVPRSHLQSRWDRAPHWGQSKKATFYKPGRELNRNGISWLLDLGLPAFRTLCGWQGLGALAGYQAWTSEVGELSSGYWSTRDLLAPHNINWQSSPRDLRSPSPR